MEVLSNDVTLHTLEQVFRDCFFDPELRIEEDMVATDVDGWDSLSHVRLLMMVEQRFDIELSARETAHLQNVGDLLRMVRATAQGRIQI